MKGLEALASRMGISSEIGVLYTPAPVPADQYLTFARDAAGEEYGFRPSGRDPNILECFYMRWEGLGRMPISETRVVTDNSAGIPLNGMRAAIIYRRADGKKKNAIFFIGHNELREGYSDMPNGYIGFHPEPIIFANGLIVARRLKDVG